tara:strand:+ start:1716 stop:1991 length:276 start_codon:yes stop_codon:yes gene_type:complete
MHPVKIGKDPILIFQHVMPSIAIRVSLALPPDPESYDQRKGEPCKRQQIKQESVPGLETQFAPEPLRPEPQRHRGDQNDSHQPRLGGLPSF